MPCANGFEGPEEARLLKAVKGSVRPLLRPPRKVPVGLIAPETPRPRAPIP